MNIYLASSWRNARQPEVLAALREAGHKVYDFRNPAPGNEGFSWKQIEGGWQAWTVEQYRHALRHSIAAVGFTFDMEALAACDACVLVLPCGRSAHLEAGWAAGAGKMLWVLIENLDEPELMYLMAHAGADSICTSVPELLQKLAEG